MYTRCPSCRAEISFEPPANAAQLPEGYKHKIKCPSCGVTIGVKIPRAESIAEIQPTYRPANPNATSPDPIFQAGAATPVANDAAARKAKPAKKTGIARNVTILITSLILVAVAALAYFINIGKLDVEFLSGLAAFDGIGVIKLLIQDLDGFKMLTTGLQIIAILPAILFLLAGISALVALISLFCKKYGRAFNLIVSLLLLAVGACIVFGGPLWMAIDGLGSIDIGEYFKAIIDSGEYLIFVGAGIALIQTVFAIIFCKSMRKRA